MRMALKLAKRAGRNNSSQPVFGAVAIFEGRAAGRGYSQRGAGVCAALTALEQAGPLATGSALYTNAEPCSDIEDGDDGVARLIAMRPARIVIGACLASTPADGPANAGAVVERLRNSGIPVDVGLIEDECRQLNCAYYKFTETGLPFVTLKFAATLDGRIATASGDSQWISSKGSLRLAHKLRRDHDAVLVGIGTVLSDDPQLTVRLVEGRNPLRVVVDSRLRIPLSAKVLSDGGAASTVIATTAQADQKRIRQIEELGARVIVVGEQRQPDCPANSVDMSALLRALGEAGVGSVLVEGGSAIITALLREHKADRLVAVIAPKIVGAGVQAIGDLGIQKLSDALTFSSIRTRKLGQDIVFDGRLNWTNSARDESRAAQRTVIPSAGLF